MEMLKVENLHVFYGAIHAIKGVEFSVDKGEIVTLIGANGAGKTTIMHTVSGLLRPKEGTVTFKGKNITGMEANRIPRLGLAQVPEGRRVFAEMTVQENLERGAYIRRDRSGIQADLSGIFERLPRLKERRKQLAGTLSGGEQQMLAIGRALMSKPEMLLLDEPTMGLSPLLVNEVFELILSVKQSGVTVLLVEQNAKKALEIADRAYVLETGRVKISGTAAEISENEAVKSAYLGG